MYVVLAGIKYAFIAVINIRFRSRSPVGHAKVRCKLIAYNPELFR